MARWIRQGVDPSDLQIRWEPVAKWLIDIIPKDTFAKECENKEVDHLVRSYQGKKKCKAKCLLTVKKNKAILDYENSNVKNFNRRNGIDLGQVRILFKNSRRQEINRIDWLENGKEYKDEAKSNWHFNERSYIEGGNKEISLEISKRNNQIRLAAIRRYGLTCQACKMNFGMKYGPIGEGYIEIHHLKPLSKRKLKESSTPINGVRVVCSNCHRMLHRNGINPIAFDAFCNLIKK